MSTNPGSPRQPDFISLSDEEGVRQVLSQTVMGLWEIVGNLARLRPTREHYRVAIFGSARAQPGTFVYDEVKRVAAALSTMGCDIVTGGGPGLMQAANEGADSVGLRERSIGIRVDLPFEQEVNPFVEHAFEHKTFFSRLHHFVLTSDAFIVVPGGIGTVLESMMIWQLLQVRHVHDVPLIFVGKMWDGLVDWARTHMLDPRLPLASPEDMEIPRCLSSADEAIELIRTLNSRWMASRSPGAAAKSAGTRPPARP